ncbi:MAG TPA: YwbE family protein [Bacteroidales bacterium]|nr:YwbE family protein [Bacteroidales bacterium]
MDGQNRNDIKIGSEVGIVKKEHQRSGTITEGVVQDILTKKPFHPHGIKVRLVSGEVGRVKISKQSEDKL